MRRDGLESGLVEEEQKEQSSSQLPPVFLPCEPSPQKSSLRMWARSGGIAHHHIGEERIPRAG